MSYKHPSNFFTIETNSNDACAQRINATARAQKEGMCMIYAQYAYISSRNLAAYIFRCKKKIMS